MATTTTTTTTSTTTEISTTVLDFTSHNNSLSSEYDLSGKKRFAGSHVLSHTSTFVDFRSIKQHYHITNMHDRCSKNVVKTYSLFSYLTFFSRPWNKVFFFWFFFDKGFYSLVPDEARPPINLKAFLRLRKTHKHAFMEKVIQYCIDFQKLALGSLLDEKLTNK